MRVHFIGIGGIGTSGLAKYYLSRGFEVTGSDLVASEITGALKKQGAKILIGPHKADNVSGADLVVYSAAIENKNSELKEARRRKIKCQTYAQALGELTKKYFTIAVSGTHGKSTTTAMLALILIEAGFDPMVIVGTKVRWGNSGQKIPPRKGARPPRGFSPNPPFSKGGEFSNFRMGQSRYLVIEADEYDASFLNYWPKIIILTNIEEDHLDYYRDIIHIRKTFKEYVNNLGRRGILVVNKDDKNVQEIVKSSKCKVRSYSAKLEVGNLNLKIPGRHNLMNAFAALTVARVLGIPDRVAVRALNKFHGTWRRFEYKGEVNGAKIFDDYGHHPTEIKATLQAAREYLKNDKRLAIGDRRLWCVFQPHQYQRTYKLFDKFVNAFDEADKVVLLPIWSVAGREKASIKKKVSSEKLVQAIKSQVASRKSQINKNQEILYLDSFKKAADYLRKNLKRGDIVVIMGAGDIYKLTAALRKS